MMIDQALAEQITNYSQKTQPILIQIFVLHMGDKIYQNTQASLFDDYIILKINSKKGIPYLKIQFNFDLIFDLQRHDDQKTNKAKLGHPHTLKFQRFNKSLSLKNSNIPKDLLEWKQILSKKLNQRGFHQLFKPIKKLGKGNFATVYLVVKYQDCQKYAVKAFSKQGTYAQDKGKQSLVNQIQVMRQLDHKNLMKLYEIYQSQNSIYISVELLEGGQLYDKIKTKYRFTIEEVKTVMKGILEGLQAMHAQGIMHRDLKPENILFRKQGDFDCVIADFGLSEKEDSKDYMFVRCGTPGYVAPQIVNLKDLKAKYSSICDLFSLGVIFHLILLRKSPFPGKEYDEVLSQNRASKFDWQSQQYKKLPEHALSLLKKLLQKDPLKRINATDALNHPFFAQFNHKQQQKVSPKIGVQAFRQQKLSINVSRVTNTTECDSPLMTTKNQARKQGKLRQDSCLKFKMKQNINFAKAEQSNENIQHVDSPAVISKKGPKNMESRFKKMVHQEE